MSNFSVDGSTVTFTPGRSTDAVNVPFSVAVTVRVTVCALASDPIENDATFRSLPSIGSPGKSARPLPSRNATQSGTSFR